jgi:hypothetical protein
MTFEEAQAAWVAAEHAATKVMLRLGSAQRDRPPYKERERYEEYQARVMAPLIEERNEARAAAKAAKQEMFKAREASEKES